MGKQATANSSTSVLSERHRSAGGVPAGSHFGTGFKSNEKTDENHAWF